MRKENDQRTQSNQRSTLPYSKNASEVTAGVPQLQKAIVADRLSKDMMCLASK